MPAAPKKKAPAKKAAVAKTPAKKVAPKKPAAPAKKPTVVAKKVTPPKPKLPQIWLHWCTPADHDRLTQFYLRELTACPAYIANPDLRAGMVNNPAEWSAKLQHAVLSTMQATFSPQLALKVALLLKRTKAKDPEILGMVRVGVNPNRSGTLLDLIVAEKHRRQGYGSLLFKGVFEQFQNVGCVEVNISVADGNEAGSAFLRKMGLRPYSVFWGVDVPPLEVRTVAREEVGGYHPTK